MINRVVKLTISVLFFAVYKIVHTISLLFGRKASPTLVVITYHSVKTAEAKRFEKQMDMLLITGKPVSLNGDISTLSYRNNIAVTFDDGYQSVLQNALPVLQTKEIPATFFVPTGCLGEKPIWINNPAHIYANEIVLTEKQLKTLPPDLITIGSHTASHVNLTHADESTVRREIVTSKNKLEELLNKEVTLFSAPYATLNKNHEELFRQAGYQRVFLNIPTFPATKTNLYILGRTSVQPTDWPIEYKLKISGAYQWLPLAISLKKILMGRNGV